jgi:hypothetical protein
MRLIAAAGLCLALLSPAMSATPTPRPTGAQPDAELLEFLGSTDALDPEMARYLAARAQKPARPVAPPVKPAEPEAGARP